MKQELTSKYFIWGEEIGKGGFGQVFAAYSRKLNKEVAVKVMGWYFNVTTN